MRHPLAFIPDQYHKKFFFTFLALSLLLFVVFGILDQPLRTDAAPNGIVSFELAGNPLIARAITDSWRGISLSQSSVAGQPNPDLVNVPYVHAAFGLGLDYLFMPIYALAIAFATLLTSRRHKGRLRSLGGIAGYAIFAAMLFDAAENYALLQVLVGKMETAYPAIAAFCAVVKFSLILIALCYVLAAGLWRTSSLPSQPEH